MEYFLDAFKKYADFTGRATRQEYWMYILIYILIYIALIVIDGLIGIPLLSLLFLLACTIPFISITTRRLHDTGRSGWWQLIAMIPLIGLIVMLIFLTQDSHDQNEYGPSPKLA
ncbi:MAG TPA: DUF805 domain-containing protein [Gammaproteobacteria bacterium]|nr:DUF805 domain-containing protein [Gammaproteobacteria bacterium]